MGAVESAGAGNDDKNDDVKGKKSSGGKERA
jgi:hypothetical protein